MNPFDKVIKSQTKLMVLSVIAVIMLVTGMSYALYQREDFNTTNQVISVGTFDANLSSTTGSITLLNQFPKSGPEENDPTYQFTVQNTGDYDFAYTVYLTDNTSSVKNSNSAYSSYTILNPNLYQYISYSLDGKEAKTLASVYDSSTGRIEILEGKFKSGGAAKNHTLQFWVNENASNDVIGTILALNINMDATAMIIKTGLYNSDGTLAYTWEEMLDAGIVVENDGTLTTFDETNLPNSSYELIVSDSVTALAGQVFQSKTKIFKLSFSGFVMAPTNSTNLFAGCSALTSLDLRNFNTSNVIDMSNMFNGCTSLTSLDLSDFNTNNVTGMTGMFRGCSALTSLDLSNFNTNNVGNMNGMFFGCSLLTSLDLRNFNTENIMFMNAMFNGCTSLTTITTCDVNIQSRYPDYNYICE